MISIVTVTYNAKDTTHKYLKSLFASLDLSQKFEVILVDNASSDGSREFFENMSKQLGNLKYFYQSENLGFSKANNIGVKHAEGEIICFINPDIEIHQNGLFEWINKNLTSDRSVIAPQIKYPNGELQPNGGTPLTLSNFLLQSLRLGQKLRRNKMVRAIGSKIFPDYLANFQTDLQSRVYPWLSGAFLVLRKSQFQEIGGFDENFFLYCEDTDLCERMSAKFGACVLSPDFTVTHEEGFKKAKANSGLSLMETSRFESNIYYLKKHHQNWQAEVLRFYYLLRYQRDFSKTASAKP